MLFNQSAPHLGGPGCGQGCRVAILDTGVDPSIASPALVFHTQYDSFDPDAAGLPPFDKNGHGTLVARIIGEIAPGAELLSIRTLGTNGTISGVLAALYLSQCAGQCDVVNLSLSVSCAADLCKVCQTPTPASTNISQLKFFFDTFTKSFPNALLVAAAGNNTRHLALPAAFDSVVAVGSFDYSHNVPISSYLHVPQDRFVLAPGGHNSKTEAFAEQCIGISSPKLMHGTSFAAAVVSGFAAKVICNLKSQHCGTPLIGSSVQGSYSAPLSVLLAELSSRSDRSWMGFDPTLHGLGAIHF